MGIPQVTPINENWHTGGFVVSEARGRRSRDQITIALGQMLLTGTVLGRQTVGATAAAAALGANTGTGVIGAVSVVSVPAQIGVYSVKFSAATLYTVTSPAGAVVGNGTVGTAFAGGGLAFTINAGGTAFVSGDTFTITTTATQGNPAAVAAAGANTGTGAIGAITTVGPPQVGAYTVEFDDATHFVVSNPAGDEIGHGVLGTLFAVGGISFTATAGGTAFLPGDSFTITVGAGSGNYAVFDPTMADGTEIAAAILYGDCNASLASKKATAITREAEVNASELVWGPNVTTTAQQTAALASLAAAGIIAR